MAAKGSVKKNAVAVQGDTNLSRTWMGNGWRTRAMRKTAEGRGASGGKATRKAMKPPPGGWTGKEGK